MHDRLARRIHHQGDGFGGQAFARDEIGDRAQVDIGADDDAAIAAMRLGNAHAERTGRRHRIGTDRRRHRAIDSCLVPRTLPRIEARGRKTAFQYLIALPVEKDQPVAALTGRLQLHRTNSNCRHLRRIESSAPGRRAEIDRLDEGTVGITRINAVQVGGLGDDLAQQRDLVVHALGRRHQEGIGDRCGEPDQRGRSSGKNPQPVDQALGKGPHVGFGIDQRCIAGPHIAETDQRP
jgi:hypothetical protein